MALARTLVRSTRTSTAVLVAGIRILVRDDEEVKGGAPREVRYRGSARAGPVRGCPRPVRRVRVSMPVAAWLMREHHIHTAVSRAFSGRIS